MNLSVNQGILEEGFEENDIVLYVQAVPIKKKDGNHPTNPNPKTYVSIPLYLDEERSGQINSFGENVNLIGMVTLESHLSQDFWKVRSAAFIAK